MTDEVARALEAISSGSTADALETETLEFKEQADSEGDAIRDIVDAVLCLANGSGGSVVVGVANKTAGVEAIQGATLESDFVRRRVYELTDPHLLVSATTIVYAQRQLLVLGVTPGLEIHADKKGRAPRRIGTDCHPMSPLEQARLREERQGIDWSAATSIRRIAEVSPAALEVARGLLATFPDGRRELSRLGDRDLLTALNVLTVDGKLTRAGELLFCDPQQGDPPLVVYQYRQTPGGEPIAIERLSDAAVMQFEQILALIRARRRLTPVTLADGQQIHVEDFPDLAVREAIANAVIHRDYTLAGAVSVDHSPEVFVVTSPGPLVSGVTPANILVHPSKPRNPLLTRVVRQLGFAEELGRGVDRMYREMIRAGREVPTIESAIDHVRVSLVGGAPNTAIARYAAQLPEKERDDTDTMLILFSLVSTKTVNGPSLEPILQKTPEEIEAVLRRLAGEPSSMLEPTRESARRRHPNYRLRDEVLQVLGSAVAYHRRTTDQIDRKVIEHVREYGKVTNRTVRNLLDVPVQRSKSILADLVARDVLVKTSEAQRGPSVEYGPGPKFPTASSGSQKASAQLSINDP